jgi:hypothetical protein
MEFEKVRKEHILKAIKDYQEKGLPKGFGPSSTYDMYYKDESYPPKAIKKRVLINLKTQILCLI